MEFDPSVGEEIRKRRPALVVSDNDVGRLPLRIVVPLTDWKPYRAQYPWFISIPADPANGLSKDSGADAFQVKSVSLLRFTRRLGAVTPTQVDEVASAVAMCVAAP